MWMPSSTVKSLSVGNYWLFSIVQMAIIFKEKRVHMSKQLEGVNVLLFGGSGGIGSELTRVLIANGVASIIVASKRQAKFQLECDSISNELVDVTDLKSVQNLAKRVESRDISVVINCTGINSNARLSVVNGLENARNEMEVNYFGLLNVSTVIGPILFARGGGVFIQVLSFLSHVNLPAMATYCASKAAAHSVTQALRAEWKSKGIRVCGVYPTAVDTTMSRDQNGPKLSPAVLATEIVEGLLNGTEDIYPGDASIAYQKLMRNPKAFEKEMAESIY